MYSHTQLLINEIAVDEPDPAAVLQEGLGGQSGGLRTMMQYLFQSTNFRGDAAAKPYKDLLQGIGTEEISAVELVDTTISNLLDESAHNGERTGPVDGPAFKGSTALKIALDTSNIHHYLVTAQGFDAGRCGRKPVAGQLRLHQRKPGPGFAMQPDARIHRQAPEVTHHRGDGQQESPLKNFLLIPVTTEVELKSADRPQAPHEIHGRVKPRAQGGVVPPLGFHP